MSSWALLTLGDGHDTLYSQVKFRGLYCVKCQYLVTGNGWGEGLEKAAEVVACVSQGPSLERAGLEEKVVT